FVPSQFSAASHTSTAGRQTTNAPCTLSFGQSLFTPSQNSSMSQTPAAGRQRKVLFASAGQAGPVPVHISVKSQIPPEGRHTVPFGWKESAGQSSVTPSQNSAWSQTPAVGRHSAVLFASGGHGALDPVHCSARSHTPCAGRHTTTLDWKASA